MSSDVRLTTGQWSFEGGVDSSKIPLIASPKNEQGLKLNQLAWLNNGTVRGGGILQRTGWQPLCTVQDGSAIYQGGWMYDTEPLGGNAPYLMLSIGGRMYQVRVDTDNSVVDVTGAFADPATVEKAYFVQGERFMIKQAGDGGTLPLFWDGNTLRRSVGLAGGPTRELPAATCMTYFGGRIWYAQNRVYTAGDIVGDTGSGTLAYNFDDAILKVTENPLAVGGDGFKVPSQAGNIRALNYPIALDTALGQGPLFVFTSKQIYALDVPVSRADWIAATANNQPLQRVVMKSNGTVSDRSVIAVNGDLFYQSLDPAIRSFFMSLRYFQTWGNSPISNNINRAMQFSDRSLMHVASGIEFNNRILQTILPFRTPVGIAFGAIGVLDTDPVSTLQDQRPPAWEGAYNGLDFLQLFTGNFGGLERAFAVVHSRKDGSIQVWELTDANRFENGDNRVTWDFETPAFDWNEYPRAAGGGPFEYKRLDGLNIWLDKIFGDVLVTVQFRPGEDPCWYDWTAFKTCAARTCAEDVNTPNCYPLVGFREQYRNPISLPRPANNECQVGNNIPVTISTKFQLKITVKGWCRVRGYELHAVQFDASPFFNMIPC